MKNFDQIRDAVKGLRNGEKKEGFLLYRDPQNREVVAVAENGKDYLVSGTFRIKIEDYKPDSATAPAAKPSKAKPKSDRPRDANGKVITTEKVKCTKCGKEFDKSIYTKSTECPDCRKSSLKHPPAQDRVIKCPTCGKDFTVSKFRPYYNGDCPECKKAKEKAAKAQTAKTSPSASPAPKNQ